MQTRLINYLKIWPLYLLPKHKLSGLVYRLTRIRCGIWKNTLINLFVRIYRVELETAASQHASDYASFNDFFTRRLKPGTRDFGIKAGAITSPVDGSISQVGTVNAGRVIQAKKKDYSLESLLANDTGMAEYFKDGAFSTLYLSPRDYHRIHMPVSGALVKSIYVPGKLFPVNNASVSVVDGLFARNERFISLFQTEIGKMAMIMVGAIFVGSMETVWMDQITPTDERALKINSYKENEISLKQNEEFGHFNMGSTVILLFEKNAIKWKNEIKASSPIEVGKILATTGDNK